MDSLKVFMYWNLHKHCWSLRATHGPLRGRVVAYCDDVKLLDCEFKVSAAGRERVLREKRKNVHAGVTGTLVRASGIPLLTGIELKGRVLGPKEGQPVRYNPYEMATFETADTHQPIFTTDWIVAKGRKVLASPLLH